MFVVFQRWPRWSDSSVPDDGTTPWPSDIYNIGGELVAVVLGDPAPPKGTQERACAIRRYT